jgi:hypothetical protein
MIFVMPKHLRHTSFRIEMAVLATTNGVWSCLVGKGTIGVYAVPAIRRFLELGGIIPITI